MCAGRLIRGNLLEAGDVSWVAASDTDLGIVRMQRD